MRALLPLIVALRRRDNAESVQIVLSDSPNGRPIETRPSTGAKVEGHPRVGGLHHRYVWKEAA